MNMSFHIKHLILWLNDGSTRKVDFLPNKVNVITGNSKTGKTAILEIIDYCFCGSESNISNEHIGDNVAWYGINFSINGKLYTIARGAYINNTKLSKKYYFSSIGEIPTIPIVTIDESGVKKKLETEFSVNDDLTFNYGGGVLKKGSKISYRYFLLFNTLSGDVINHTKVFFDKMDNQRYKEALDRIFDLCIGITTIENMLVYDKMKDTEIKIKKLERKRDSLLEELSEHETKLKLIIKQAKTLKIISSNIEDTAECVDLLNQLLTSGNLSLVEYVENTELDKLKIEKQKIELQISKLKKFIAQHERYKNSLKKDADSLKPVQYLQQHFAHKIKNEEYALFLDVLEAEYLSIKKEIKNKPAFTYDIQNTLSRLSDSLAKINKDIELMPILDDTLKSDSQRLISLGELKASFLSSTKCSTSTDQVDQELMNARNIWDELSSNYLPLEESKSTKISALNEYIQMYLDESGDALDEYATYLSDFDYAKKILRLRKPKSTTSTNITSSSDHLFLHLCLFLGMHHLILDNDIPYVIPFLIIDQPSRPYFNNTLDFDYTNSQKYLYKKSDWAKVKQIFKLFDYYYDNLLTAKKEFQIILLEHVSQEAWSDCKHIHLVEEFDGIENALIRYK